LRPAFPCNSGFRSVADAAQTITEFDKKGIELVAISEGFDMTSAYGRAMAQMASVFAEPERAMIRERTKAAMNVKRGRNERMSHQVPFGWDEGQDGILERNEKEQRAIVQMQQWQRNGKSLRQIAALLNDQGVEPKRAKRWLHSSVLRILARTA
jgi:site-specific DNA recombinase